MTGQEYVESYRQRLDEIKQRADGAVSELSEISATPHSRDNAVSVTVNPSGGLEDLQLGKGTERMSPERLQKLILETARQAQADAGRQVEAAMKSLLGESEGMDFLRSQLAKEPDADRDTSNERTNTDDDDNDDDEGFKGIFR